MAVELFRYFMYYRTNLNMCHSQMRNCEWRKILLSPYHYALKIEIKDGRLGIWLIREKQYLFVSSRTDRTLPYGLWSQRRTAYCSYVLLYYLIRGRRIASKLCEIIGTSYDRRKMYVQTYEIMTNWLIFTIDERRFQMRLITMSIFRIHRLSINILILLLFSEDSFIYSFNVRDGCSFNHYRENVLPTVVNPGAVDTETRESSATANPCHVHGALSNWILPGT